MILPSNIIKQTAHNCGFALCGIAKSEFLINEKERFEKALAQNFHAKKHYLERDIEKRFRPELLFKNCKTVVVCGFNYNTQDVGAKNLLPAEKSKIARYEQIEDYHVFMKVKLEQLAQCLQEECGLFNYKTTVDTSAISEKAWAVQAGIGYYGKNGIIQTQVGSFVFLGTLLIDKEVDIYDTPNQNSCGNCTRCISACPTKAIVAPYCVDSNRCITHILQYGPDVASVAKYGWCVVCEECQDVCPNNLDGSYSA